MTALQVPYIADSEIEEKVAALLQRYATYSGEPVATPIPIDAICENLLSLTVWVVDMEKHTGEQGVLGAVWFDQKIVRIEQSIVPHEGRYSFTLAHETGHWILHRPTWELSTRTRSLFESESHAPNVICRTRDANVRLEIQADRFAAFLLMPAVLVRTAFSALIAESPSLKPTIDTSGRQINPSREVRDLAAAVIDQGRFSNVSNDAMCIRLRTLGLVGPPSQTDRLF